MDDIPIDTDAAKYRAWGAEYAQKRGEGRAGWCDRYETKQGRLDAAFRRYGIAPGAAFLELGCGAGNVSRWAAERGMRSTGIDIVPEAIEWAREQCIPARALSPAFVCADVSDMCCLPDAAFDVAFDGDCLHMVFGAARSNALREVLRVLRPGGLFLLGGNVAKAHVTGRVGMGDAGHYDGATRTIHLQGRPEYQLRTEDELVAEVRDAGFQIERIHRSPARGSQPFIDACVEIDARRPA